MDPDLSERREPSKTKMTKMSSKIVNQKMERVEDRESKNGRLDRFEKSTDVVK
jgi:hypothetical protein